MHTEKKSLTITASRCGDIDVKNKRRFCFLKIYAKNQPKTFTKKLFFASVKVFIFGLSINRSGMIVKVCPL
jgi:hypothetical protein